MSIFRLLYKNLETESSAELRARNNSYSGSPNQDPRGDNTNVVNQGGSGKKNIIQQEVSGFDDGVGDVEGSGFGVGLAPLGKPAKLQANKLNPQSAGIGPSVSVSIPFKKNIVDDDSNTEVSLIIHD